MEYRKIASLDHYIPMLKRNNYSGCFDSRMDSIVEFSVEFALLSTYIMTSSNGKIFHVTGPLWRESTGHMCIPLTKASNADLWCFLSVPEQTVEQTIETPVIWDSVALIITSL